MNDNIKAGADHHAGDGGYKESTQEKYNEFVKDRNQSLAKGRLEELWWKARTGSVNNHQNPEVLEKFAELIVRECAEWVNDNVGLIDEEARADLLKHFGVEL